MPLCSWVIKESLESDYSSQKKANINSLIMFILFLVRLNYVYKSLTLSISTGVMFLHVFRH
jgi:hypothetical protein